VSAAAALAETDAKDKANAIEAAHSPLIPKRSTIVMILVIVSASREWLTAQAFSARVCPRMYLPAMTHRPVPETRLPPGAFARTYRRHFAIVNNILRIESW